MSFYNGYRRRNDAYLINAIIRKRKRLVKKIHEWQEMLGYSEQYWNCETLDEKRQIFDFYGFDVLNMHCELDFEDYVKEMETPQNVLEIITDEEHFTKLQDGIKKQIELMTDELNKCVYHKNKTETTDFGINI